jgi:hypothetical protein
MAAAVAAPLWASIGPDTTPLLDKQLVLELPHTDAQRLSLLDPKPDT